MADYPTWSHGNVDAPVGSPMLAGQRFTYHGPSAFDTTGGQLSPLGVYLIESVRFDDVSGRYSIRFSQLSPRKGAALLLHLDDGPQGSQFHLLRPWVEPVQIVHAIPAIVAEAAGDWLARRWAESLEESGIGSFLSDDVAEMITDLIDSTVSALDRDASPEAVCTLPHYAAEDQ